MHKWQLLGIVSLGCIGLWGPCLANDAGALLPNHDMMGCSVLIQQGSANPPSLNPSVDMNTLQTCLDNCDSLYKDLGDQGHMEDMFRGSNYCRKSLNNLYYSSVAQTINEQLDQQTQQQHADQQQTLLEKVAGLIKQNQQQNQQSNQMTVNNPSEPTPAPTTPPASAPQQPVAPLDNIKW